MYFIFSLLVLHPGTSMSAIVMLNSEVSAVLWSAIAVIELSASESVVVLTDIPLSYKYIA